jgi:ring-1,2-phenylacetyl-CoA epoxidase subunit PaaC
MVDLLPSERTMLIELLYQMADDELVIGHRDSEWLGLAPHIEEDIAFASIGQDELGHANIYFKLLEELGEGLVDDLAFLRPAKARRNAILVERPNGKGTYLLDPEFDWAYTIVRRTAYDLYDAARLDVVARSAYLPLAQVAAKIRREEKYHLLHQATWFKLLATTTAEARQRLDLAISQVFVEVGSLFAMGALTTSRIFPATTQDILDWWSTEFKALFAAAGVPWPTTFIMRPPIGLDGRRGQHTPELDSLLATMGEVYRSAPGASW